jgi:3-oxoacyl-[acyl-carrier protein] reductase
MDLGITGRVAIVGGASRGLGKACAVRLATEGVKVVICARGEEALQQTAAEIRQGCGTDVLAVPSDWSRYDDIRRTVRAALDAFSRIDILVHNTGGPPAGGFFDQTDDTWQKGFELVLLSAVRMYREVIPHMQKHRWGRIVNIESTTVKEPWETIILSSVFRVGVISVSKTLSQALAKDNILINTVCPGPFRTERAESILRSQAEKAGKSVDEVMAEWVRGIPRGRMGEPEELANLVAFLASDRASHITGTTIQTDGGAVKGLF